MKLEQEIRRKKAFANDKEKLMANLAYTYSWYTENLKVALKQFSLNDLHFSVLEALESLGPDMATMGEVRAAMPQSKGDLTRLVEKLQRLGYVLRVMNPDNRREMLCGLTPLGADILEKIRGQVRLASMTKRISLKEARLVNQVLDKMRG